MSERIREKKEPGDDLRDLAERAMEEKYKEVGDEAQAQELWDLPTKTDGELAEQQKDQA